MFLRHSVGRFGEISAGSVPQPSDHVDGMERRSPSARIPSGSATRGRSNRGKRVLFREEIRSGVGYREMGTAPSLIGSHEPYYVMTGNQFHFTVRDQKIHLLSMRQFESRGDCCLELLCDLVVNWPELFEGRTGSVFYGDMPPPDHLADKKLSFCTTIRMGHSVPWLPFPC